MTSMDNQPSDAAELRRQAEEIASRRLAMTGSGLIFKCHCEETSDEAISNDQLISSGKELQ